MKYLRLFESKIKWGIPDDEKSENQTTYDLLNSIRLDTEDVLQDIVDRGMISILDSIVTDDIHWFKRHYLYNLYGPESGKDLPLTKHSIRIDDIYIRLILDDPSFPFRSTDKFTYFKTLLAPVLKRISTQYTCDIYIGFSYVVLKNGETSSVCNVFIQDSTVR